MGVEPCHFYFSNPQHEHLTPLLPCLTERMISLADLCRPAVCPGSKCSSTLLTTTVFSTHTHNLHEVLLYINRIMTLSHMFIWRPNTQRQTLNPGF